MNSVIRQKNYLLFWCLSGHRAMLDVLLQLLITVHEDGGRRELQHQLTTQVLLQEVVRQLHFLGIEEVSVFIENSQ